MTDATPAWIPLDEIAAQEAELQLGSLTHDDAWELGRTLVEAARAQQAPVTIDISIGDQQVFRAALPGSSTDHVSWIERKTRAVRRFGHSSLYLGQEAREEGVTFDDKHALDPALYAAHGGGFPLVVAGTGLVGVAVVSGLPQLDDHALVVQALRTFLGTDPS
ncbi:heme-degrading domain-containing protein [Sanguibacter sp. 25GB23B1]|uniref:heme-degrading domain-containing protein n=1 Tax=unclassified Sanguibacter TaxID=2645534 RepID=UPI0032B00A8C